MPSKKVNAAIRKVERDEAHEKFLRQLESHRGKWVAHQNGEILAVHADFSELLAAVGDRKVEVLLIPIEDYSSELL